MSLLRLAVKKGAYGYFNITFDTYSIPTSKKLSDYSFRWGLQRTLTQSEPNLILDSDVVPDQFAIQSSQSVLLTTIPDNTVNLIPGAYYWEFLLYESNNPSADLLSPPVSYGDLILLESIL